MKDVSERAREASGEILVERRVHCGYAVGNKTWVNDPQAVCWENFHTYSADMATFGCGAEESWRENRAGERTGAAQSCPAKPDAQQDKQT